MVMDGSHITNSLSICLLGCACNLNIALSSTGVAAIHSLASDVFPSVCRYEEHVSAYAEYRAVCAHGIADDVQ